MAEFRTVKALSVALALVVPIAVGCGKKEDKPARPAAPAAAAPAAATASGATGTASISGKVTFTGTAPKAAAMKMDADPACAKAHTSPVKSEEVVVNADGTLKNVIVYVKSGISGTYPASGSPELDQVDCVYTPHVIAVQAGQSITVHNSDPTLHNVQASPAMNAGFNLAMPPNTPSIQQTFAQAEASPVKFKCQVHPWMTAYVGVFNHPFFAVTDGSGQFSIKNLPAGKYTVGVWHEKYGEKTFDIEVTDGQAATQDVSVGS
ncbi:hypothetical protein FJZ36_07790 [Candidatus Poribacteria bacterium]|nr:hypothetical protein [Candidatus Poribacteria bacterium]